MLLVPPTFGKCPLALVALAAALPSMHCTQCTALNAFQSVQSVKIYVAKFCKLWHATPKTSNTCPISASFVLTKSKFCKKTVTWARSPTGKKKIESHSFWKSDSLT